MEHLARSRSWEINMRPLRNYLAAKWVMFLCSIKKTSSWWMSALTTRSFKMTSQRIARQRTIRNRIVKIQIMNLLSLSFDRGHSATWEISLPVPPNQNWDSAQQETKLIRLSRCSARLLQTGNSLNILNRQTQKARVSTSMTKTQAAQVHLNPVENTMVEVLVMDKKQYPPTCTSNRTTPDKKTTMKLNQTNSMTRLSSTLDQMSTSIQRTLLSNSKKKLWCKWTSRTMPTLTVIRQHNSKTTTMSSLLKTEHLKDPKWMTAFRATQGAELQEVLNLCEMGRWISWRMKVKRCFMVNRQTNSMTKMKWFSSMRMSAMVSMTAFTAKGRSWGLEQNNKQLAPASSTTQYRWSQHKSEKSMKYWADKTAHLSMKAIKLRTTAK